MPKTVNPYGSFRPADSSFFNKIDEKIIKLKKENKKEPLEFYENAKSFVMNSIELRKGSLVKDFDRMPKLLIDLISDRNIDKLYEGYLNDTKKVAKELFSSEMSINEICACAIEYVRLCSSNFASYESEAKRNEVSELAEKFAKSYNGVLAFYLGIGDDTDRTQLLARLVNVGLDIIKSISYAECVVDFKGIPICQVVEFSGKPMLSLTSYNGIEKVYTKNIGNLSSMYSFLDFSEHIPMAKKRALKTLLMFHNFSSIFSKSNGLEKSIIQLCENASKNLSNVTVGEQNPLVKVNTKIFKLSTLIELNFYQRKTEYEIIPDLFNENLVSYKLDVKGYKRFKVFPNKVIDKDYQLSPTASYLYAKQQVESSFDDDPDLNKDADNDIDFSENDNEVKNDNFEVEQNVDNGYENGSNIDSITPLPASEVLEKLQTKFKPNESENTFLLDGTKFDLTENPFSQVSLATQEELDNAKEVDLKQAEQEQLLFEQEMGITVSEKNTIQPRKQSFYEIMQDMASTISKNRAKKLQEKYEEYDRSGELQKNNLTLDSGNLNVNTSDNNQEIEKENNIFDYESITKNSNMFLELENLFKDNSYSTDEDNEFEDDEISEKISNEVLPLKHPEMQNSSYEEELFTNELLENEGLENQDKVVLNEEKQNSSELNESDELKNDDLQLISDNILNQNDEQENIESDNDNANIKEQNDLVNENDKINEEQDESPEFENELTQLPQEINENNEVDNYNKEQTVKENNDYVSNNNYENIIYDNEQSENVKSLDIETDEPQTNISENKREIEENSSQIKTPKPNKVVIPKLIKPNMLKNNLQLDENKNNNITNNLSGLNDKKDKDTEEKQKNMNKNGIPKMPNKVPKLPKRKI